MPVISSGQVKSYAKAAGFNSAQADVMDIIAKHESGRNTTVVNEGRDVGLWQINIKAHPQWSTAWLKNPANNARAAFTLAQSDGLQPWSSSADKWLPEVEGKLYGGKSHKELFSKVPGGAAVGGALDTGQDIAQGADPLAAISAVVQGLGDAIDAVSGWVGNPHNWVRLLQVVGGIALGVAAVAAVAGDTPVGKAATKAITKGAI